MSDPRQPVRPPDELVPALSYRTVAPNEAASRRAFWVIVVIVCVIFFGSIVLALFVYRGLSSRSAAAVAAQVAQRNAALAQRSAAVAAQQAQGMNDDYETRASKAAFQRYLSYAPEPGTVVYEEDPVAARDLLSASSPVTGEYHPARPWEVDQTYANAFQPPAYAVAPAGVNPIPPFVERDVNRHRCALFVGLRTSPGGHARLVFLEMDVRIQGVRPADVKRAGYEYALSIDRKLGYRLFDANETSSHPMPVRRGTSLTVKTGAGDRVPITWIDGTLRPNLSPGSGVRFYAGLPDPADPSHFTVEYEVAGTRGLIDGWLTDDDFLRIVPRTGTVDRGTWTVTATTKPGTMPAVDK